jgi:hypothetical protein
VELSDIAREMLGTGRRALVGVMAGGAWLTWGLITAHVVSTAALVPLILVAGLLFTGCGYCMVKGRALRKMHPYPRRPLSLGFLAVSVVEAAGVGGVILAAQKMGRLDMLPDWIGVVIGLHFFALAKVFEMRVYYCTGTGITVWCLLCWWLFRGDGLGVAVGTGIGSILWATALFGLVRALRAEAGVKAKSI